MHCGERPNDTRADFARADSEEVPGIAGIAKVAFAEATSVDNVRVLIGTDTRVRIANEVVLELV